MAKRKEIDITTNVDGKSHTFTAYMFTPLGKKNVPMFLYINRFEWMRRCVFRGTINQRLPIEEIMNRGYGLIFFCTDDVSSEMLDTGVDYRIGLHEVLGIDETAPDNLGSVGLWAFATMRVMDYLPLCKNVDLDHVAIIGHSRLGKTALFTGAMDERFRYVISNDSGCTGAALSRGKDGEDIEKICDRFPYWFCPKYKRYAGKENEMPFDQHFLLSLVAPRHLMVGSAKEDLWADPKNEFLCAAAANEAYALYGMKGLVHNNTFPAPDTELDEGDCLYHYRFGEHYLSRLDWNAYMDFIDKKRAKV